MRLKFIGYNTIPSLYNKNSAAPLNNGMFEGPVTLYQNRRITGEKHNFLNPVRKRLAGGHA